MLSFLSQNVEGLWTVGHFSGVLRGPGSHPTLQNGLLPECGPALPAPGLLEGMIRSPPHLGFYVELFLLQLLTSSTTLLVCPLLAPQKVKALATIQSYTWRPPPLRGFFDFPNKRDLTEELPGHFISTSFYITLIFFSCVKWSVLIVEKLRNVEKIKGKYHSIPQHREIIVVNIFPCYPVSLSDDFLKETYLRTYHGYSLFFLTFYHEYISMLLIFWCLISTWT